MLIGMIEKFDPSREQNSNSWLSGMAYEYMEHNKHKRPAVYYHLPKWDQETLAAAEELASHPKKRLRTLLNVIDTIGLEAAQKLYDTDRRIKKSVVEARQILEDIAAQAILTDGFTTQKKLTQQLRQKTRRKCFKELNRKKLVQDYTQTMCENYYWKYGRPTKEEVEKWKLRKKNGEPKLEWIIRPEGSERA